MKTIIPPYKIFGSPVMVTPDGCRNLFEIEEWMDCLKRYGKPWGHIPVTEDCLVEIILMAEKIKGFGINEKLCEKIP